MNDERLMEVLYSPHISEKSTQFLEHKNTLVIKVAKNSSKAVIKRAIQKFYGLQVKSVNIVVVKKRMRAYGKNQSLGKSGRLYTWRKAYISLTDGCQVDEIMKSIKND
ncbi:MAG: 50S ribosomal protein L23 [Candidatus Dasytiphilus stammeri]